MTKNTPEPTKLPDEPISPGVTEAQAHTPQAAGSLKTPHQASGPGSDHIRPPKPTDKPEEATDQKQTSSDPTSDKASEATSSPPETPVKRVIPWSYLIAITILFIVSIGGFVSYKAGHLTPIVNRGERFWAWLTNQKTDKTNDSKGTSTYWTCPMHPQIIRDGPGECPICGMTLVEKKKESSAEHQQAPPGLVTIDPRTIQILGVTTEVVGRKTLEKVIRTTGDVTYDETKDQMIHSWVAGRIDKLFADYTGQLIKPGQPVAEIYSPQLVSSQEELLLALDYLKKLQEGGALPEAIEQAEELADSARKRLLLWGMTPGQIDQIIKEGKARTEVTIYAPVGGTILKKIAHVGLYVKEGSPLYRVADLSTVWVYVAVYEKDLPWVHLGQWVDLTTQAHPGQIFRGQITFIDPVIDLRSRTAKVRIEIPNADGSLLPGMYMIARLRSTIAKDALTVPDSAVIRTGKRDIVILSLGGGKMRPQEIVVGPLVDNYYQVLSGLHGGERVITQANFLIDSESQLKAALQRLDGAKPPGGHQHH